jgi:outer membrane protein assembly factor BamC
MTRKRCAIAKLSLLSVALIALAACSGPTTLFDSKKIDYKSAGKIPPLEIPPDLTAPTTEDRYAIPDAKGQGAASASSIAKERAPAGSQANAGPVLPTSDKAKVQRSGNQRWLVVKADPQDVWPVVRDFWQENGFILKSEAQDAGVMETDWAENRAKIPQDFLRNTLGKVFSDIYSTSERDKFRTRLERGAEQGTTEVYVSHRGMQEVYTSAEKKDTRWQPRPVDPDLEAEMLSRLASRFGLENARDQAKAATPKEVEKAKLTKRSDGSNQLAINEGFDRAWRRVGLALDRVGFTVEDRDRSKGLYFVRYVDPQEDNKVKPKGFFARIFGSGDPKPGKQEQYRILVSDAGESTEVQVQDRSGAAEKSQAAGKILDLLYEQLK